LFMHAPGMIFLSLLELPVPDGLLTGHIWVCNGMAVAMTIYSIQEIWMGPHLKIKAAIQRLIVLGGPQIRVLTTAHTQQEGKH